MNRVYKLVWSVRQQAWVVGSELAKSAGKASAKTVQVTAWLLSSLLASAAYAIPASNALPTGESVVAGAASFDRSVSNQLTVNQSSNKLISSWNSFNVGASAKVVFNQPDASSIALNRVTSGSPTEIFGRVTANGQLVLVNPAGLTVGSTGQVNAASVIASTLDISDSNFNAGKLSFERGSATGEVNNQGSILSANGSTVLLAPVIRNAGTTRSMSGNVLLGNANKATFENHAVTLNQGLSIAGLIQSTGTIRADKMSTTNGKILLLGDTTRVRSSVQLAGVLNASAVEVSAKTVEVTGTLDSNANTSINAAGNIYINGAVNISGNSRLLSLTHATTAGNGYFLGANGKISMPGISNAFQVNGKSFSLIQTLEQLQAIGSSTATLADNYVIVNDIDASSTASTSFNPLGSSTSAFTGSINGLGNTVKNLNINKPSLDNVGLVGYAIGGQLKNIRLTDVNIIGRNHVGGLVGSSYGNGGILNLSNNVVSGTVKGKYRVGGLLGYASINAMASLNVTANTTNADVSADSQAGGQLGSAEVLSGSFLLDGGQVDGFTHASTTAGVKYSVGGLVGYLSSSGDSVSTIKNSVVNGDVSAIRQVFELGGAIGRVEQFGHAITTLNSIRVNGDISVSRDVAGEDIGGVIGVAKNEFGNTIKVIVADIHHDADVTAENSARVGGLMGYSTGVMLSNSVSSANVTGANGVGGLVGITGGDGKISYSHSSGEVRGKDYVGGLVGMNHDTLEYSDASGNVSGSGGGVGGLVGENRASVEASHATGSVSGRYSVGGLTGSNSALVSTSYATGNIVGHSNIGGLIGVNEGSINQSFASGAVTGESLVGGLVGQFFINNNSIVNSYATGNVIANYNVGGLVGNIMSSGNFTANISNNYAISAVSARAGGTGDAIGGLIGKIDTGPSTLNIEVNYATGAITGNYHTGGLVGQVYAVGSANRINILNNYATGAVTGNYAYTGGFIGGIQINSGDIYIQNNYASGLVSSPYTGRIGGFIGAAYDSGTSYIYRNYWDKTASGQTVAIGENQLKRSVSVTGLSSSKMTQQASFVGWDISNLTTGSNSIWYINEGISAPVLRSQMSH